MSNVMGIRITKSRAVLVAGFFAFSLCISGGIVAVRNVRSAAARTADL